MKYIILIVLSILISGCACTPPVVVSKKIDFNEQVLQKCDNLDENISISTFDQFITLYGNLAIKYTKCANQQSDSVELLKKLGNNNGSK